MEKSVKRLATLEKVKISIRYHAHNFSFKSKHTVSHRVIQLMVSFQGACLQLDM